MKHSVKTFIFKTLDLLPNKIGYYIYHQLQNLSENKNLDYKIKSTESTFEELIAILKQLSVDLKNESVIEIGSGWLPIMPYFFKYKSTAENIYTYDLNEHYQKQSIAKFNTEFSKTYNCSVVPYLQNKYDLPEGIHYFPSQNVIDAQIPKVAIVFSRFVLEHVTPDDIIGMHKKFKNTLAKGTLLVHFISPSDHRAYSDKSLSLQDFLKYSKKEWDSIQTKFDYHNRLRLPEYQEIFDSLGLETVFLSSDNTEQGTPQHDLFKNLQLHSDYTKYSEQELTAGSIKIVLKI